MESVNHICDCSNGFSEAEKKQADAIAGGSFEKLLTEFQILRTSFGEKNRTTNSGNPFQNSRASDVRDIFFLRNEKPEDASSSLENIFSSSKSGTQFENSRASGILDIFFLNQKKMKESETPAFDKDAPFDLEKLRRDPSQSREVPNFLEKKFELFGPTTISRFI